MERTPPESPRESTEEDSTSLESSSISTESGSQSPPSQVHPEREKLHIWPIPQSIRDIIQFDATDKGNFVTYQDLQAYLKEYRHDPSIPDEPQLRLEESPDPRNTPTILIDLSSTNLYRGPLPSLDLLPWLFVYIRCPGVRFIARACRIVSDRICKFIGEVVLPNRAFWLQGVVVNKAIREIRVFLHVDRTLDLVLEPDSEWAREWNCRPYTPPDDVNHMNVFTTCLGLNLVNWEGHVVVASVED